MEGLRYAVRIRIKMAAGTLSGGVSSPPAHQHAAGAARRKRLAETSTDDDVVEFHNFVGRAALLKGSPDRSLVPVETKYICKKATTVCAARMGLASRTTSGRSIADLAF